MRIKVDYNHLLDEIADVLGHSTYAKRTGADFGISIGLQIMNGYIKDIAKHAIETNDETLIDLLVGLNVIKETGQEASNAATELHDKS